MKSSAFPKLLASEVDTSLKYLESLFSSGEDVNPYQSKGLILYNDTSGVKRQQRTDLLWADWGIHHLHLPITTVAAGSYFTSRSEWLLFCLIGSDFVSFIDIRHHSDKDLFADIDLLSLIADSWPEFMEHYRVKGVQSSRDLIASAELTSLRRSGVSSFVNINGQLYMGPGMGVTSASTPARVTLAFNNIRRYVDELAKIVFDHSGQFKIDAVDSGLSDPEYSLALTPQGLAVYENMMNKAFVLPRSGNANDQNFLTELHDLLVPAWVVKFLVSKAPDD